MPKKLTGPFSNRQHDLARGFRLLAHAEIEAYLEDRSGEVALTAVRQFMADRKPRPVVWSLVSFQLVQEQLTDNHLKNHYGGTLDRLEDVVTKAHNSYKYMLLHNHGIRETNVLKMLLPIGFARTEIDTTWLSTMDSFGTNRGETAHTSYKPTQLVDPATEKSTVDEILKGLAVLDPVFSRLR
ncbi:MAG TPA: HEPN domain-containing protein [Terriglobales bacterium]|nr:HEPN domain-containing protein [Terriglobales bacterium]